jgi:hypothetical protein
MLNLLEIIPAKSEVLVEIWWIHTENTHKGIILGKPRRLSHILRYLSVVRFDLRRWASEKAELRA